MPKVPTYQPDQVREEITPRSAFNVNVSREALGGGQSSQRVFEAAGNLGQQVYKSEIEARERAADALTVEYDGQLSTIQNDLDNEIKTKYQGRNAIDAQKYANAEWQKRSSELIGKIQDPLARGRVSAAAKKRSAELYNSAGDFATNQLLQYEENTYKSYVQNMRNDGVANYQNPERIRDSLDRQQAAILAWGQNRGLSDEEIRNQLTNAESKTHLSIITRMINENKDMMAKGYAEDIADKLAGDDKDTAMKLIESATLRGESQRRSTQIFASSADMNEALEKARKISDPELQDETVNRVKQLFADKKKSEDMANENLHKRAADIIDQTGNVDMIPREDWLKFSLSERSALQSYAKKRAEGADITTSWPDYYELKTMAANDKKSFNDVNLMFYRSKLGDAEFKELVTLQTNARNGRPDEKALDGYRTDSMIVNDALKAAGYEPSPKKGSKDAVSVAKFRATVDQQIKQRQQITGKKATNEEVQQIVDNLLVEVVTKPGFIFDTKKRVFELEPNETGVVKIDDIPKSERRLIEDALRRANRPVTETAVIEMYTKKLSRM